MHFARLVRAVAPGVLFVVATGVAVALAEGASRLLEGMPLTAVLLPALAPLPPERSLGGLVHDLPHVEGLDPAWIEESPPPLSNRGPVAPELVAIRRAAGGRIALESNLYRQWNARYVAGAGCAPDGLLRQLPPPLLVFDPPEPNLQPIYRFPLGVTTPLGLITNRFGWRGPEIPLDKPPRTIRLAFIGASTTVGAHEFPFSYPELVVHWLNVWAERTGERVRFDGINAGREGLHSTAIAAIVRQELVATEPDLVVYYEGANQFSFANLIDIPVAPRNMTPPYPPGLWNDLATPLRPYWSLVRRIDRLQLMVAMHDGAEPPKPAYNLTWPAGVDEREPDVARRDLPLGLPRILTDLDSIRGALDTIGAELAVSSFAWLVYDGMRLEPGRDIPKFRMLNESEWPFRYADVRRMADFQNRVLARYAALRDLLFVDVAAGVPLEPELFIDSIHFTQEGTRVQAWAVLNGILPRIRQRIAAGAWPRPDRVPMRDHPGIAPPRRISGCAAEPDARAD
jgi:hypothetical protein